MEEFKFDPVDGWEDVSEFPTTPADETATRTLFQKLYNQIRDFINTKIVAGHNAHLADNVTQKEVHGLRIETGTFTPVLAGEATAGTNTYSIQTGYYHRNGKMVHCDISLVLTAKDSAMAGTVRIIGLPFASKNAANRISSVSIGMAGYINFGTGYTQLMGYITANNIGITLIKAGSNVNIAYLQSSDITNTTLLRVSFDYEIN